MHWLSATYVQGQADPAMLGWLTFRTQSHRIIHKRLDIVGVFNAMISANSRQALCILCYRHLVHSASNFRTPWGRCNCIYVVVWGAGVCCKRNSAHATACRFHFHSSNAKHCLYARPRHMPVVCGFNVFLLVSACVACMCTALRF